MKVVHLNFRDAGGGAAIAARRLHQGLRAAGVDSTLRVKSRRTDDPAVSELAYPTSLPARMERRWERSRTAAEMKPYRRALETGVSLFSNDRAPGGDGFWDALPRDAVVNLHWIAGIVDMQPHTLQAARGRPLVWSLHDYNPFTGGCHYPLGCERFTGDCGRCPALKSEREQDLSRRIHARKTASYRAFDPRLTRIVAPSVALAREAASSSLFARLDVITIPHGVDTEVFKPRDQALARDLLGIPAEAQVILFAAASVDSPLKGIDILAAALSQMRRPDVIVVSIGASEVTLDREIRHISLGEFHNERLMSLAYSAADIFVTPARAEAFGLVAAEAMASGLPIIAADVGGLSDMVRDGHNGVLVPPLDVAGFRSALDTLIDDAELRARFGLASRRRALDEFSLDLQVSRYKVLYESLALAGAGR